MNSWLSNFIIEEFRTDYMPEAKMKKNIFMGTIDLSGSPLPVLFEAKITIKIGNKYNQEVFQNDIFIFNLDDSNLSEVEFMIHGLQAIKYENKKILILISNIMTWSNTPIKTLEINKESFDEEKVPDIQEKIIIKEKNEITEEKSENNEEDKKREMSKVSKDTKKSKNKEKNIKDNKIGVKYSKKELEKMNNELIKDK